MLGFEIWIQNFEFCDRRTKNKPAGKPRQKGHGCRKNSRLSILIKGPNPPMTTTMALENSVCGQQRLQTTAFVDDRALVDNSVVDDRACGQSRQ